MKRPLVIGYVVLIAVLGVLPLVSMFAGSVWDETGITLRNYAILADWNVYSLLRDTLFLCVLTVFWTLILGIPISYLIIRTRMLFRNSIYVLLLIPLFLPPYILAVAWRSILARNGLAYHLLGIGDWTTSFLDSIWGCAFILGLAFFPVVILFITNALRYTISSEEDAARLDGNEMQVLRYITLPDILPAILSSSLLVFILAFSEFGVPMVLGVRVFTGEIFTQFAAFYNEKTAVAMSLPVVIITIILILLERKLLENAASATDDTSSQRCKQHNLGPWSIPAFIALCSVVFVSVCLPIGVIISKVSPESFGRAMQMAERPMMMSLGMACVASTMLAFLGLGAGYLVERGKRQSIDLALMLLVAVPATILGIGLIKFWNTASIVGIVYTTPIIIVIGYVVRFFIFSERIYVASLSQLPISIEESAFSDGASSIEVGRYILWPLLRPAFATAWILTFIFCFGELTASIIVYPAGGATLPISLFTIMANSAESLTAAMSVMLIIPILGAVSLFFVMAHRMKLLSIN